MSVLELPRQLKINSAVKTASPKKTSIHFPNFNFLAKNIFLCLVSNLQLVLHLYPPGHLRNSLVKKFYFVLFKNVTECV